MNIVIILQFDGILENSSQESVYTQTTHEVVDNVLAGINGTVFCYGQVCLGLTSFEAITDG